MLIVIILSIPSVQTKIAKKVTENLNETYKTSISIDRLGLNWKGEVDIREVYIADHHDDTLIYARQLLTNVVSFSNLIKGDLGFGDILLEDAKFYVKTYKGEDDDNLFIFTEKFNTGKPSTTPFSMFSNDVELRNGHVRITDENLETPEILDLYNVQLRARDFNVDGPVVEAEVIALSMLMERGIDVKNLSADFSYNLEEMQFRNMQLQTGASDIRGNITLDYAENGLADFVNNVKILAEFEKTVIATNDLNRLYNEFGPDQLIYLDGTVEGILNDFQLKDAAIRTGNSSLSGEYHFRNLFKAEDEFYINARNHRINTDYYDLRRLLPRVLGDVLPNELKTLGRVSFNGNTSITARDLVTESVINSRIGTVDADLSMGNIDDFDNTTYKGKAVLSKFNLGKIVGTPSLGPVTANLTFDGRGFSQRTVNTRVEGTIATFEFEGYPYKNITLSGNMRYPLFDGKLTIDDPNLRMNFNGLVDVSKEFNQYDFEANIDYAELNKLKLVTRDSIAVFAGRVIMDMDGTNINDLEGTIEFAETFYQNEEDDFFFDDFLVISTFEGPVRTIEINSPDIINGQISGEFLIEDVPNLFRNGVGNIYANYIPIEVTNNQYIDYEFDIYNKLVEVFVPQLQFGENTRIKGSVSSDESKFQLDFRSPEIIVFDNYLSNINVQVDNDNPLFNTYISIDSLDAGKYDLTDINIINKTLQDTLYIKSKFKGGSGDKDLFNLSLYHTINPNGKSVVGVKKSEITYNNNVWFINEKNNNLNKITFDDNYKNILVDSLVLNHNDEYIRFAGSIRDSTYKDLKLQFDNVHLGSVAPDIDSLDLQGVVNGRLNFIQKRGAYYPHSEVTIDGVAINGVEFGNLDLQVRGNESLTRYDINTTLTNNNLKSINAVGAIDVSTDRPTIDLNIELNNFNMMAFSPFGADVISDIRGYISGNARVSGNYKSPNILGNFVLEDSGMKIPYLNTDFNLEDNTRITVTKNKFEIAGGTQITDTKYNTVGMLRGNATHVDFGSWELNLDISTDRLLVLDTPPDEEALYYGTAFISGTADISGPVEELVIDVVATTEEGTSFKIPLSDTESIGDNSFIRFLSPEEKAARISGESIVAEDIKGLSLNFELDINENAEVEVVVDQVNDSRLIGRGAGILLIEINTLGKFRMWGDFLVIEGKYDFRYGGLVQKEFEVVQGGNITWDGIPERARLDLTAKYLTNANPSILLDNPSINRKIPVEVLIDLTGELIQPNIDFRIDFPRTTSTVRSELDYKLQNRDQRETQALFLLATGSFVSDSFRGAGSFSSSLVAESVAGIVNDIFADQDNKFVVGLDYTPGQNLPDQDISDQIGITLTTQINERILINGKVGVPVGGINETAVAGDIEVQWLVNEDGSLRINFFNRQADIQFIGEDQIFEQGAGISYSVDFNTFRELVNKLFNRKLTLESENSLPVIPDDNTIPIDFNPQAIKQEED